MATGRAIMTDSERSYLAGEEGDQRKHEAASRLRSRIQGPLQEDVEHLRDHHPDILDELQDVVCSGFESPK